MANNSSATRQVSQPGFGEQTPYVGPRPFRREDKDIFFGRNQESLELTSLIKAHPEVLLYAQSGAGKTSLIYAQVIPILEDEEEFDVLPAARVRSQESAGIPEEKIENIYVFNALKDLSDNHLSVAERANMTLAAYLSKLPRPPLESPNSAEEPRNLNPKVQSETRLPRVIIFDQFEEIFTLYPERYKDREDFFCQVAAALAADPYLRVVFSMREDYIAELDPYIHILPEKLRTGFRLERLRQLSALAAVKQPLQSERVKNTGRRFAEGVAESLVESLMLIKLKTASGEKKEVPGEFVDPVQLQVVCQTLWGKLPDTESIITSEHLEKYANVDEALSDFYESSIAQAVERANAVIDVGEVGVISAAAEPSITEGAVRGWFEQALITREGKRNVIFRERQTTGGLSNLVVDELENQHLIRVEMRGGEPWYELSHDRFITPIRESNRRWLLQQPLAKQKAQELESCAAEWLASNRDSNLLLDRGSLGEAKIWLSSPEAKAIGYTETLYSLIKESEAAIEHKDRRYERALAAEQHSRMQAEHRRARQLKLGLVIASVLLVFTLASTGVAINKWRQANWAQSKAQDALNQATDAQKSEEKVRQKVQEQNRKLEETAKQIEAAKNQEAGLRKKAESERSIAQRARASADQARREVNQQNAQLDLKRRFLELGLVREVSRGLAARVDSQLSRDPIEALKLAVAAYDLVTDQWVSVEAQHSLRRAYQNLRAKKESNILSGHKDVVWKAVYSPHDGSIVTYSEDKTVRVFNPTNYQETRVLSHPGPVHALAISKGGTIATEVNSIDTNGVTGRIWHGSDSIDLRGLTGPIAAIAFSPTEELLATEATNQDNKRGAAPRIWDATNGTIRHTLLGHEGAVCALVFSPKGDRLATASWDQTARIWDVATGRPVSVFRGHTGRVISVAFDPTGELVVTGSEDGTARVWEAATGKQKWVLAGLGAIVQELTFSPNGEFILVVGTSEQSSLTGKTTLVWSAKTGRPVAILIGHTGQVNSARFSSDDSRIVTASDDGTARVWNTETGESLTELRGHGKPVKSAMFSADNQQVVTAGADGTAQVWALKDTVVKVQPKGSALSAKFDSRGTSIVTLGAEGVFKWELTEKPIPRSEGELKLGRVYDVAISPDRKFVVSASAINYGRNKTDTEAHVWDLSSPATSLKTLGAHTGPVNRVLYSPKGTYVLTVSRDGTAGVWNTSTWTRLQTLKPSNVKKDAGRISGSAFSPDEKYVVTGQQNGTIHIWEIATGENIGVVRAHDRDITSVAFSAKGDLIVISSLDSTASIWTTVMTSDGKRISTLKRTVALMLIGHEGPVYDAELSPDGEFVVTSGADSTVRVWETVSGAPVTEFRVPESRLLLSAAFNLDNTSIVTRDDYGTVYVFECEVCRKIDDIRQFASQHYSKQITPEEIKRVREKYR